MEDDYKNLLDDIDFCLRKCIAVYCVKKYRKKKHLSQGKLGESLGVTQSTVSDWENDMGSSEFKIDSTMNSRLAPTPLTILKFSAYAHISIAEMVWDVISEEERKPKFCKPEILDEIKKIGAGLKLPQQGKAVEDKGSDHFGRINLLRNSRYLGFICESDGSLSHFIMETSADATSAASVHAYIHLIGKAMHVYRCKIVSPPNQMHLYVYMRQDSGKNDRGIMTFWADTDMGYEFLCGSGVLYSTERQNGQKRIQWVVILRIGNNSNHLTLNSGLEKNAIYIQQSLEENTRATDDKDKRFTDTDEVKKADEIIRGTLTEPLPNSSGYYLDFDCLKQRQKDFFENAYEGLLDQIDMETAWKRIYDQQEGNQ